MILEFSQLGFIGKKSVGFIYFSEIIVSFGILDSFFFLIFLFTLKLSLFFGNVLLLRKFSLEK